MNQKDYRGKDNVSRMSLTTMAVSRISDFNRLELFVSCRRMQSEKNGYFFLHWSVIRYGKPDWTHRQPVAW